MNLPRHALGAILFATLGFLAGSACEPSREPAPSAAPPPAPPATGSAVGSAPDAAPIVAPGTAAASTPSSASSAAGPGDAALLHRAREGDLPALKALEAREPRDRTIEESLALEAGHAALARKEALRLVEDLAADPALFRDPATMAHVYRLALDPAVAPTLLAGLATQRHAVVPDLLFDLMTRGEPGARLVLLAEDLLLGAARGNASSALEIALQARASRTCERMLALLPRVAEQADDRALPILRRLDVRTGCGPKRADDCHVCLREPARAKELEAAREAAAARRFVAPWALAGR